MNPFVKWYLIGAAVSLLIQLIHMFTSNRIKVSMVIGYVLNTALSWGCPVTLICQVVIDKLEKHHKNKVLWVSESYQKMEKKFKRSHH